MAFPSLIGKKTIGPSRFLIFLTEYNALEPAISREIMQIHHLKHHQTSISHYNTALWNLEEAMEKGDSSSVVKLQSAVKFNGGGHINHSIFWKNLTPVREGGGDPPTGALGTAIDDQFGNLEALMQKIKAEGALLQDSGWVCLGLDRFMKRLVVETTANQYKNVKLDYLRNVWSFINWKYASEMYDKECPKGPLV